MDGSRAERMHRRAAAALLAFSLLAPGCSTPPKSFLLHPLPPAGEGYAMVSGALLYQDQKVEAELRPLDPKLVSRRLAEEGRPDPFLFPGEDAPVPLVFELRLRAPGKRPVYFNPAQVRGMDDDKNRYYPLGFSDFYRIHGEDSDLEGKLKSFNELCYDAPVELKPGQEVTRYLPLSAAESAPENLVVTVPLLYDGKEGIFPSFTFEGFPVEEKPELTGKGK